MVPTFLISLFALQACWAQEEISIPRIYVFSFSGITDIPIGQMDQDLDGLGWGIHGSIGMQIRREAPFFLSLAGSFSQFDREESNYIILDNQLEYDVTHYLSTNLIDGRLSVRYQPEVRFIIYPFVELSWGFQRYYTFSRIEETSTEDVYDRYTDQSDWTWIYGVSSGFNVYLRDNVYIKASLSYTSGVPVDFHSRTSEDDFIDPLDNFELQRSPVQLLIPSIGVETFF